MDNNKYTATEVFEGLKENVIFVDLFMLIIFIGDWVDEYCDLTLDKLIIEQRDVNPHNTLVGHIDSSEFEYSDYSGRKTEEVVSRLQETVKEKTSINKEFDIKHNFLYFLKVEKKLSSQIKENSTKDFFQDNIKNNIKENSDLYKEAREEYVNWARNNNIDIWKG